MPTFQDTNIKRSRTSIIWNIIIQSSYTSNYNSALGGLIIIHGCFGETYFLHLQDRR
jgi:hypothetical protein